MPFNTLMTFDISSGTRTAYDLSQCNYPLCGRVVNKLFVSAWLSWVAMTKLFWQRNGLCRNRPFGWVMANQSWSRKGTLGNSEWHVLLQCFILRKAPATYRYTDSSFDSLVPSVFCLFLFFSRFLFRSLLRFFLLCHSNWHVRNSVFTFLFVYDIIRQPSFVSVNNEKII